jgi:hypothetical protein
VRHLGTSSVFGENESHDSFRFWWEAAGFHTLEHDCFFAPPTTDFESSACFINPTPPSITATTMNFCLASTILLTILWTFAIMLLPDDTPRNASAQRADGLVVAGNHYVLDTNIDQTRSGNGSYRVIRAVNVKTPRNTKRVSYILDIMCATVVSSLLFLTPNFVSYSESKSCCDERSLECIN